jgi:hypothetical protein
MMRRDAAGARGIRRGCSLANSAGTYEFAREHPATSRAPDASQRIARARAVRDPQVSDFRSPQERTRGVPPAKRARKLPSAECRARRPWGKIE